MAAQLPLCLVGPGTVAVVRVQMLPLPRNLRLRPDNRHCDQLRGLVGRCYRLLGFNGACRDVRNAVARPNGREFLFLRFSVSGQLQWSGLETPPPGGWGWEHGGTPVFNGTRDSYEVP